MEFKKYQHIERFGTSEVEGIELGTCYVFYKIDGTNGSVWLDSNGQIKAGSRNRELTLDNDNAGFHNHVVNNPNLKAYLAKYPNHRLFGEWLVPHSLKTYREDSWKKFYVFDIQLESGHYIPYEQYSTALQEFGIEYIPPIAIVRNGNIGKFYNLLEKSGEFLVEDGRGKGEGIVIKNYDWQNRYGRQIWAKMVTNEFKEKHSKTMGVPSIQSLLIEEKIVEKYCTEAFIEKEYAKIVLEEGGWSSKYIPKLLGKVFHELVREEIWNFVKENKLPTVNFRTLNYLVVEKVKEAKKELF